MNYKFKGGMEVDNIMIPIYQLKEWCMSLGKLLLVVCALGWIAAYLSRMKSMINFACISAAIKGLLYGMLVIGMLFFDPATKHMGWSLPKEVTLTQYLLIPITALECIVNLFQAFKEFFSSLSQ